MTSMRTAPAILFIALFTLAPVSTLAVWGLPSQPSGGTSSDGTPVTLKSIETFVTDAIDAFLTIAALAVVGGLAYAGFLMVTSGPDPKRYEQGKKMLYQVIIGGVVIFGIGVIANTIANFSRNPSSLGSDGGEVQQLQIQDRKFDQLSR